MIQDMVTRMVIRLYIFNGVYHEHTALPGCLWAYNNICAHSRRKFPPIWNMKLHYQLTRPQIQTVLFSYSRQNSCFFCLSLVTCFCGDHVIQIGIDVSAVVSCISFVGCEKTSSFLDS